ncbi:MAG TPA: glycosyltransferase [Caulobacteraceae bacterium]|nr:glycosyltransferase [Caulobacteraceae bacterium]
MRPLIAYVGPFAFPDGGAAARRILGNARSLREAGFEVEIASGQTQGPAAHEGFTVHSLGERTAEHMPSGLKRLLYAGMGQRTVAWLDALLERPAAVILYSGYSPYFMRLAPWCAANRVPLIFDAVEWYDPPRRIDWLRSPYYWNTELAMRHFAARAGNIIAISSYLEGYYRARGCNTVLVPPTLDTETVTPNLEPGDGAPLVVAYTGTPGHKDLFDAYLEALIDLDPEGRRVRLRMAGLSPEEVLAFPALRRKGARALPGCVEVLGRVPQEKAMELTRAADFSVLLRPDTRTSKAGFPTKVVESLSVGTPVICNHTSDLGRHIREGREGVVCRDGTVAALKEALQRAMALSPQERREMRAAARAEAERSFDYRRHTDALAEFVRRAQ